MPTTFHYETTTVHEYIKKMAPNDYLLSECLRKPIEEKEGEERPSWRDKPLNEMYRQRKCLIMRKHTRG